MVENRTFEMATLNASRSRGYSVNTMSEYDTKGYSIQMVSALNVATASRGVTKLTEKRTAL